MQKTVERESLEESRYMASIQSLSDELVQATAAISRNDIDTLWKHLACQQALCAQLSQLQASCDKVRLSVESSPELAEALRVLAHNQRTFSTLIAMASRSNRAMLLLCSAYKNTSSSDRDLSPMAISCEV